MSSEHVAQLARVDTNERAPPASAPREGLRSFAVSVEDNAPPRVELIESDMRLVEVSAHARAALAITQINHDPEWLSVSLRRTAGSELWVFSEAAGRQVKGLALLSMSKAALNYTLTGVAVAKVPVRKFELFQGPAVAEADEDAFIGRLFETIAVVTPARSAVFANDVPTGSPLQRQMNDPHSRLRRSFFVLPWGKETQHCRIRWHGSVDTYLQSIGPESRRNLKRYSKKLFATPGLTCEVKRFHAEADCDAFLRDGARIADKTYQNALYGHTLKEGSVANAQIRFAAQRGAFLGHILYINGEPAAFHYGIIFHLTFFALEMGFDPHWSHQQAGSVLFFEMLKDLEEIGLPLECIDYMSLETTFKLRTTNDKRPVRNYYLFRRSVIGAMQYFSLKGTEWLSRAAVALVERLHLRRRLEKLLRRR